MHPNHPGQPPEATTPPFLRRQLHAPTGAGEGPAAGLPADPGARRLRLSAPKNRRRNQKKDQHSQVGLDRPHSYRDDLRIVDQRVSSLRHCHTSPFPTTACPICHASGCCAGMTACGRLLGGFPAPDSPPARSTSLARDAIYLAGVSETPRSTSPAWALRKSWNASLRAGVVAVGWSVRVTSLLGSAPLSTLPLMVEVTE